MDFINSFRQLSFPVIDNASARQIIERLGKINKESITISFCGTFKSGKSSLINSILGARILPTKATTATAVVTRLHYSDKPTAAVKREYAAQDVRTEEISFNDISEYILLRNKTLNGVVLSNIKEVSIGLPHAFLKAGVELVDTPGLDDDKKLTQVTMNELRKADLAVIVYNGSRFMSLDEKKTVYEINELLGGNVVFAVNKMDSVDDRESVVEAAEYYLSKYGNSILGRKSIIYTSANETGPQVKELLNMLSGLASPGRREKIIYFSRLSILKRDMEDRLNEAMNEWDRYRTEYEKYEQSHSNRISSLSCDMRTKVKQLGRRINGVRYNLEAYLNPFKQMCITVAKEEGLLQGSSFNSFLLAQCIDGTNRQFVMEFLRKLKKLFNEFSVNFDISFVPKTRTTSAAIDSYLAYTLKANSSFWGNMVHSILGSDVYSEVNRMVNGGSSERYMTAYVLAIDDEITGLKSQIMDVLDRVEQNIVNFSNSYTPNVTPPPELLQTYSLMDKADEAVRWYRDCISRVNSILKKAA